MSISAGQLYVVATPIGNLSDLSSRAQQTLKDVDLIAAEDTRHSRILLQHYGINTPLRALHQHNEQKTVLPLIEQMQQGRDIALISDAGTPLISDPGARLVDHAHQQQIRVVAIPGPSAVISALSIAGLAADTFYFAGFLPPKTSQRQQRLTELDQHACTMVCYEAPHRILASIQDCIQVFGEQRQAALVKEISKRYEHAYRAPLIDLLVWLQAEPARQKGEFVVLIQGAEQKVSELDVQSQQTMQILCAELPLKQASLLGSQLTGLSKKVLYRYGLSLKNAAETST